MKTRSLWIGFIIVMVVSFGVLGYFGIEIYREAPPIPERVVSVNGETVFTAKQFSY